MLYPFHAFHIAHFSANRLLQPLLRIFGPIMENPESLLKGDHTKKIKISTSSAKRGIMAFAVRKLGCLAPGCSVPLRAGVHTVCEVSWSWDVLDVSPPAQLPLLVTIVLLLCC